MGYTTYSDCAACEMVGRCDAHVTGGTWHHREGVDPCVFKAYDMGTRGENRVKAGRNNHE